MHIRNILVVSISSLFALFLCSGCFSKKENEKPKTKINSEKSIHDIYERSSKEGQKSGAGATGDLKISEAKRKRLVALADACLKRYDFCLKKCNSSTCENECIKRLSACEKDLPQDLRTIKEK